MKKGLSVLLIAAALFGFYGGATNLNDVLACKDYFTAASGASDDMQRLEDGLNQLKDNEQAYLDGQVALEEGKKTLDEGYATLADGEKQYAAGLKAYKAAPGQLADGEKALKDLKKLISGLETAKKHGTQSTAKHDVYWHDGFSNSLAPGRQLIVNGLNAAQADGSLPLLEKLTGQSGLAKKAANAGSYNNFDALVAKQLIPTFRGAAAGLESYATEAESKAATLKKAKDAYDGLTQLEGSWAKVSGGIKAASQGQLDLGDKATADKEESAVNFIVENKKALEANEQTKGLVAFAGLKDAFAGMSESPYYKGAAASVLILGGVGQQMTAFLSSDKGSTLKDIAANGDASKGQEEGASLADQVAALVQGITALSQITGQGAKDGATFSAVAPQVVAGLNNAAGELRKSAKTASDNADLFQQWDDGYQTLEHAKDGETSAKYPDDLASKSSGIPFAFKNMVTNKTIKAAIKQYDPSLMKILKKYSGNRLQVEGMVNFDKDITYLGKEVIPRAIKVLNKVKAKGQADLAAGYKSYKEAPAKLADARQQLAEGRQALADGEKQLADGEAQLAQYEDGEQQVRDGLATLVGTDAMGDVQSIADRIGNDTDFDNGDKHLELDEGLSAVEAGKGYAADLTEAVTSEIMGRAIGTGLLIGAGVLAVLAALLSFLKKNKGAGVSALLAAAAGCVGAVMGNGAGTQFSSIAGSAVGATPWIAAGILAAVAAVHAIVHFTAKKEA